MRLYNAVEMRELSLTPDAYREAKVDVEGAILATLDTPTFTVTVVTSGFSMPTASQLKSELIQLGYAVDDSTTPGSWIITW